jgi:hypothetical protein
VNSFLILLAFTGIAFAAEDAGAGKLPDSDQALIDKAVNSNLGDADKAYSTYLSVLAKSQTKVMASLEKLKADANNVHKGNMDLKERSALVEAIEAKEKEIKDGSLGDVVVLNEKSSENVDLLGVAQGPKQMIVGKWDVSYSNGQHDVIQVDEKFHVHVISSTWSQVDYNLEFSDNKFTVTRVGNLQTYSFDGDNLTMTHGSNVTANLTRK